MTALPIIAEGKTKIIYDLGNGRVKVQSKDDITGGDGTRHDLMENKAVLANTTTCNVFECLRRAGVTSHFIRKDADDSFIARRMIMIPVEVVMRRIAFGSYLERHPEVDEGTRFGEVTVEFFEKDDDNHDPLLDIYYDSSGPAVFRRDAHLPLSSEALGPYPADLAKGLLEYQTSLETTGRRVFETLEAAWAKLGHTLVDLKIEFGFDAERGVLLLADVIDNDSWRVWLDGDPTKPVDKQVYRDFGLEEPETAKRIKGNYALVAKLTESF